MLVKRSCIRILCRHFGFAADCCCCWPDVVLVVDVVVVSCFIIHNVSLYLLLLLLCLLYYNTVYSFFSSSKESCLYSLNLLIGLVGAMFACFVVVDVVVACLWFLLL